MLTVEQAQARVDALAEEAQGLEASLLELESQKVTLDKELDAGYVAAERTPTPQAQREASQLEARANLHNGQLHRKRVALESCKTDLVEARANLERARKAAAVVELEAIYLQLVKICRGLDKNISDPTAWGAMNDKLKELNRIFQGVRPADHPWKRTLAIDAGLVFGRVLDTLRVKVDRAFNPTVYRGIDVRFETVGAALELEALQQNIAHLRRLHIDEVASIAAAPTLEAVPA